MNYFPFHVGDYAAHTSHLEPMEDLAYRRMLDLYYRTEMPLPRDVNEIARLIRLKGHKEAISIVLEEFFTDGPEGWENQRCDKEIAKMQEKQAKARSSAHASVSARNAKAQRTLSERSTNAERTLNEGSATNTNTNTNTKEKTARKRAPPVVIECPEGVDQQVWADWLALRKAKRAPVTATTISGATAEAAKAGMSLDAFLRAWCRRGSQGLEADWLKPNERGSPVGATVQANPQIDATQAYLAQQAAHAANAKGPSPEVLAKLRGVLKAVA